MRGLSVIPLLLGLAATATCGTALEARAQSAADPDGIEFFEKSIRPILVERCSQCHGGRTKKAEGGLVVMPRSGLLEGGDSGPAIVPGDPDSSLLIRAIRYTDEALRMPPKGRLAPEEVSAFEAWVKRGAPAPDPAPASGEHDPVASGPSTRGDHWAFRVPRAGHPYEGPGRRPDRRVPPRWAREPRPVPGSPRRSADAHPPRDLRPDRPAPDTRRGRGVPGGRVPGCLRQGRRPPAGLAPVRGALGEALAGPGPLHRRLRRGLAVSRLGHPGLQRGYVLRPVHRPPGRRRPPPRAGAGCDQHRRDRRDGDAGHWPMGRDRPAEAAGRHRRRPGRHDRPEPPGPDDRLRPLP